ncbi:hypothetical protein DZC73_14355 [Albitalea terrae]|uniref:Uncharacterized protein n=1 Tax=Piscinibacter terrae TaxID=2496871 RepID=A0A3N7HQJ1_9BURK|nr:hypothetical protein DZC73_14355 [Albitalea terrae]
MPTNWPCARCWPAARCAWGADGSTPPRPPTSTCSAWPSPMPCVGAASSSPPATRAARCLWRSCRCTVPPTAKRWPCWCWAGAARPTR